MKKENPINDNIIHTIIPISDIITKNNKPKIKNIIESMIKGITYLK